VSFSDLTFLFYFLPLFFAVYYILPFRFKNAALVLGSFAFYFIGAGARDTLLLSGVLLLHYALARAMAGKEVRTRKALLIIALAADLFCLVYFKYAAFILENLGKLTGTAFSLVELALPLGVSFYLFQSAGYLIDVYRGEEAEKNLIDYAAFTIAFPQLTMGPILRYREWRGALKERTITREDVFSGFELFVVGLCFKVLLADQLAPLWASLERIGYEYLSTPLAWLGAVSYFAFCARLFRPLWAFWAEVLFSFARLAAAPLRWLQKVYGKLAKLCKRYFLFSRNRLIIKSYERRARYSLRRARKKEAHRHDRAGQKKQKAHQLSHDARHRNSDRTGRGAAHSSAEPDRRRAQPAHRAAERS